MAAVVAPEEMSRISFYIGFAMSGKSLPFIEEELASLSASFPCERIEIEESKKETPLD